MPAKEAGGTGKAHGDIGEEEVYILGRFGGGTSNAKTLSWIT